MSTNKLIIEVFARREESRNWESLPTTSKYLTDKQLIPNVGDALTIASKDGESLGLGKVDSQNIQTVKRRWFNYGTSDVAVFLEYEAW